MDAHAADLGMTFYTGQMFPQKYRGGIFSAQHGSWNRTTPIGARVMFTSLKDDGTADKTEVFAEGWLTDERRVSRPAGRRRAAAGRLDPGLRRFRRRDLPDLVRRPVSPDRRAASARRGPSPRCGWRCRAAAIAGSRSHSLSFRWLERAGKAGDVAAGRRKALQCQTCHGLDGLSRLPEAPHLAGQPERYLVKSLDDYRRGSRNNEMMTIVVKELSDQDIADLAAYYAAIEISTKPPQ